MSRIFYTADLHFGHKNIIEYENRPFIDLGDMESQLIIKWNTKVRPCDTVYILGDFAFQGANLSYRNIEDILARLNGTKILIAGNHDKWVSKQGFNEKYFKQIIPYAEIKDTIKGKTVDVVLCHYPIEDWNGMFYGSYHIHRSYT